MAANQHHIELDCRFIHETGAAVLVEINEEEVWIPLSQVSRMRKAPTGEGTIAFSQFIANQKGLI